MYLVQVAPVTAPDEPFLIEMMALAMRSLPLHAAKSQSELEFLAGLELGRQQPGRDYFFQAWSNHHRAGAMWLHAEGEFNQRQFTLGLAVQAVHRRKGVATALLRYAFEFVRQQGGQHLFLKVHPSNQAALALYHKLNFQVSMLEMKHDLSGPVQP